MDDEACLRNLSKEQMKQLLCAMQPVVKIDENRFLIGTQIKTLHVKQNKLVLSTGGGFTELKTWIKKNAVLQSIKLSKVMAETSEQDSQ